MSHKAQFKILKWTFLLKVRCTVEKKYVLPFSVLFYIAFYINNLRGDFCVMQLVTQHSSLYRKVSPEGPIHVSPAPSVQKSSSLTHMFICMWVVLVSCINFWRVLATQKGITNPPHSNKIQSPEQKHKVAAIITDSEENA